MVTPQTLEQIETIARRAGAAILERYDRATTVELKADRSPLTDADRAAHQLIAGALAAAWPDIPVISEEGAVPPYDERRHWTAFWLVDPLDGTKEFLQRNGEFTVNIALVERGAPVLGVVFAPALDVMYAGGRTLGSCRIDDGGRAPIRSAPPPPGAPVIVAESRSHPSPELEAYLATRPVARRVQAGSSLKFCWVAEGRADIYPRFGPTMEWDTAAGDCVYRYSGRDRERRSPLRYNSETLRHESFVIGDDTP